MAGQLCSLLLILTCVIHILSAQPYGVNEQKLSDCNSKYCFDLCCDLSLFFNSKQAAGEILILYPIYIVHCRAMGRFLKMGVGLFC